MNVDPMYPFGFGLSYTDISVKLKCLPISKKENCIVSVKVTNTGNA
jgi:beta-glucosidase